MFDNRTFTFKVSKYPSFYSDKISVHACHGTRNKELCWEHYGIRYYFST